MDIAAIEALVDRATRAALPGIQVDHLVVAEESDKDGDPVISVLVVYDDARRHPSGDQMLDAQVALQDALLDEGDPRFPLLTFVASSEAEKAA